MATIYWVISQFKKDVLFLGAAVKSMCSSILTTSSSMLSHSLFYPPPPLWIQFVVAVAPRMMMILLQQHMIGQSEPGQDWSLLPQFVVAKPNEISPLKRISKSAPLFRCHCRPQQIIYSLCAQEIFSWTSQNSEIFLFEKYLMFHFAIKVMCIQVI